MIGILAPFICIAMYVPAHAAAVRGEEIGPITATVTRVDDERGLAVRSEPSPTARILGRLGMGERITGYNEFRNGWVKIRNPINGGWVEMASLRPVLGNAVVISVDRPEMCLRIRSGPGSFYGLVGCAQKGDRLRMTGLGSENNWAEIDRPVKGWVSLPQISTDPGAYRGQAATPPRPPVYVEEPLPPPAYVEEPLPPVSTYVIPYGGYYGGYYPIRPYWRHHVRPYWRNNYRGSGVAVRVGPRGGVGVRAGGVGVRVGPRGGVGVRVR
jgi:hypothetical protein